MSDRDAKRILLSPPHAGDDERKALLDAFDTGWLAPAGPELAGFEADMCARIGVEHAVALSSGTAALHLALEVLGVGRDDTVFTSTLTFAASANAIRYVSAEPVFIDSDDVSWNMDPALLDEALDEAAARGALPKAVVVVDLYGQCADYDRILATCRRHDVPVIEDAAEALGATYRGRAAGAFGAMAAFSFNGNKIITTSGGGMLVSDNEAWIERARYLSTQARQPTLHYEHTDVGYNYRLSNLLAALGRAQLRNLDARMARRREINAAYRAALALPGLSFMPEASYGTANCWLTCLTVDAAAFGASAADVIAHLGARNIEARPVWKPMHLQPVYSDCRVYGGAVAQRLFETGLCLPSGSSMSADDLERVVEAVRTTPRRARRAS